MTANVPQPDSNLIGWFVAVGGAIGTAAIAAWKWLNANKLSQAGTDAQLDVINMLKEQLAVERARADEYQQARDLALDTVRQLKDQVSRLAMQVQQLENTIKATTPPSAQT